MQKVNYKALVVKYICNVLIFAVIYTLATYVLLVAVRLNEVLINVVAISAAVLAVMGAMKKIGPWIDKRFGNP